MTILHVIETFPKWWHSTALESDSMQFTNIDTIDYQLTINRGEICATSTGLMKRYELQGGIRIGGLLPATEPTPGGPGGGNHSKSSDSRLKDHAGDPHHVGG